MSIKANSNEGHRQRLREKILKSGLDGFHPSTSSTGIGDNNVIGLKITQDVARRYLADRIVDLDYIRSSEDVLDYLKHNLQYKNR